MCACVCMKEFERLKLFLDSVAPALELLRCETVLHAGFECARECVFPVWGHRCPSSIANMLAPVLNAYERREALELTPSVHLALYTGIAMGAWSKGCVCVPVPVCGCVCVCLCVNE